MHILWVHWAWVEVFAAEHAMEWWHITLPVISEDGSFFMKKGTLPSSVEGKDTWTIKKHALQYVRLSHHYNPNTNTKPVTKKPTKLPCIYVITLGSGRRLNTGMERNRLWIEGSKPQHISYDTALAPWGQPLTQLSWATATAPPAGKVITLTLSLDH